MLHRPRHSFTRRIHITLLALAASTCTAPALADDTALARALFDSAMASMKAGQYSAEICAKLEESNRLDRALGTQFFYGECLEKIGRTATAWATYLDVADGARNAKLRDHEKYAREVATNQNGDITVAGGFSGSLDFPQPLVGAGHDAWLAKLDGAGNVLWAHALGDTEFQHASAVAIDPAGNVIIGGFFSGDIVFDEDVLSSHDSDSIYVAKFAADGSYVWSRKIAASDVTSSEPLGLAVTPSGDVVVASSFAGTLDTGGTLLNAFDGMDVFVCKLAATSGAVVWAKAFTGMGDQHAHRAVVDPGGNVIVSGIATASFSVDFDDVYVNPGESAVFVLRLDGQGNPDWLKGFGGQGGQQISDALAVDGLGNIHLAGLFAGTFKVGDGSLVSQGTSNIFFVKVTPSGKPLLAQRFGERTFAGHGPVSLAAHSDGSTRLTVHAKGDADFGGGVVRGPAANDAASDFLAAFDTNGAHSWSKVFGDFTRKGAVL